MRWPGRRFPESPWAARRSISARGGLLGVAAVGNAQPFPSASPCRRGPRGRVTPRSSGPRRAWRILVEPAPSGSRSSNSLSATARIMCRAAEMAAVVAAPISAPSSSPKRCAALAASWTAICTRSQRSSMARRYLGRRRRGTAVRTNPSTRPATWPAARRPAPGPTPPRDRAAPGRPSRRCRGHRAACARAAGMGDLDHLARPFGEAAPAEDGRQAGLGCLGAQEVVIGDRPVLDQIPGRIERGPVVEQANPQSRQRIQRRRWP